MTIYAVTTETLGGRKKRLSAHLTRASADFAVEGTRWRTIEEIEVPLSTDDLVVGGTYRGKNPRKINNLLHPDCGKYPDRTIVWMGRDEVQYDGPAVRIGANYPKMKKTDFLLWAKSVVSVNES